MSGIDKCKNRELALITFVRVIFYNMLNFILAEQEF